ncbi:MAG: glycosyltransferase family 1 protein [Acidithiobacillus caldus]|uniref:glycosyltransferase family 4 protein n=1 Tax=Acidithiobacillus caldus TaxID=33059 RepID=UPI002815C2A6|nr:glycosyltransferase family 1 protein [Acidithiobacillus caldus]WMT47183.1 MAG: glycosyltransferase family 1 protein [Acidithiobacillus caldus]
MEPGLEYQSVGGAGTAGAPAALRVWLELRPALDGFYGIPQETRLLFSALASLEHLELSGFLQMSKRRLRGGVYGQKAHDTAESIQRASQVVVSLKGQTALDWKTTVAEWLQEQWADLRLRWRTWLTGQMATGRFDGSPFADYLWQELFGRSLPAAERERVLRHAQYRICAEPWRWMHLAGIERAQVLGRSRYPRVDTRGADIFIAQTPFPGRVRHETALVVHYHDAIPVLMPHTISDRAFHQASHYHALAANVRDGAWFACVSETTRQDLLRLFPEAETRSATVYNMIPSHYHPTEPEPERIPGIVRRYSHVEFLGKSKTGGTAAGKLPWKTWALQRRFSSEEQRAEFLQRTLGPGNRFLLMVSTIEPRKNHARLLAAWEALHAEDPQLRLILVGHIGWDYEQALDAMIPWVEEGSLFLLQNVPSDSLRLLFRQALVTVCPSVGEGFDFSGIEAMRCAGVTAASDIPVHREVYGDATVYFDPYDTASLVQALRPLLYGPEAEARREALRERGVRHSERYLPERILPEWEAFLRRVRP